MRIERIELRPYRLALRQPWRSARGLLRERRGWLVAVAAGGAWGYGDCAPLPAAGTEPAGLAGRALGALQSRLAAVALGEALALLDSAPNPPAARCAVQVALADLQARLAGVPLRSLDAAARDRVAVNAALGPLDTGAAARAATAAAAGYRVLKFKVGLAAPGQELGRLRALAETLPPQVRLRLDANGAWDAATARAFLAAAQDLPVECLEEPLAQPDPARLRELQAGCRFPLALDESVAGNGAVMDPADCPVRRLVVKVPVLGGMDRVLSLAQRAAAADVEVVLTSLLDSAAAIWPALQLAASLPREQVHGLATSDWLATDLGSAPQVTGGQVVLPVAPGSGFTPAP